jgi:hypothetical protein
MSLSTKVGDRANLKVLLSPKKVILFLIISGLAYYALYNFFYSPLDIKFSETRVDGTLSDFTNEFSPGQPLHFNFFLYGDGSVVEIIIERKHDDGSFSVINRLRKDYPPNWIRMDIISTLSAPYEQGEYFMKVINVADDRVIGKGKFTVK